MWRLVVGGLCACLSALCLVRCGHGGPTTPDSTPIVLKNVGSEIAPYDPATDLAGDVFLQPWVPHAFGEFARGTTDEQGHPKILPTWDIVIPDSTPIKAAIDGVVVQIFTQSSPTFTDYELLIAPTKNYDYFVSYDHVQNLQVSLNATVHVGQTMAFGDPYPPDFVWHGKHAAIYEFMVASQKQNVAFCPIDLLDPALKDLYRAKVTQLMQDLAPFQKDNPILLYHPELMVEPGCLAHTAPV
jgi:hypothetical protein